MQNYKQRPVCVECESRNWTEIKVKKYKNIFDFPKDFYEKSYFLKNVRSYYERNKKLTEKQIEAVKKTIKELQEK